MQSIRVAIRATDPTTLAEIERELADLRGQEPPGAELIDDPSPQPKVVDPLLTTAGIALLAGAGGKLGEIVIEWLVERIRRIVAKRKAKVTLTVAGVQLTVDEQAKPEHLAAQFGKAMARKP